MQAWGPNWLDDNLYAMICTYIYQDEAKRNRKAREELRILYLPRVERPTADVLAEIRRIGPESNLLQARFVSREEAEAPIQNIGRPFERLGDLITRMRKEVHEWQPDADYLQKHFYLQLHEASALRCQDLNDEEKTVCCRSPEVFEASHATGGGDFAGLHEHIHDLFTHIKHGIDTQKPEAYLLPWIAELYVLQGVAWPIVSDANYKYGPAFPSEITSFTCNSEWKLFNMWTCMQTQERPLRDARGRLSMEVNIGVTHRGSIVHYEYDLKDSDMQVCRKCTCRWCKSFQMDKAAWDTSGQQQQHTLSSLHEEEVVVGWEDSSDDNGSIV